MFRRDRVYTHVYTYVCICVYVRLLYMAVFFVNLRHLHGRRGAKSKMKEIWNKMKKIVTQNTNIRQREEGF